MGFKGFFVLISVSRDLTTDLAVDSGREINRIDDDVIERLSVPGMPTMARALVFRKLAMVRIVMGSAKTRFR